MKKRFFSLLMCAFLLAAPVVSNVETNEVSTCSIIFDDLYDVY